MSKRIGDPRHGILRRQTSKPPADAPAAAASGAGSTKPSGSWLTRASAALASPLSVLIVVPGLVVLVGLVLTLMADHALRGSNLEVARQRLSDQAQTVGDLVRVALEQADPMLERLSGLVSEYDPSLPPEPLAHGMADLLLGRPGVTYISASFPDGRFQAVYVADDHSLRFQDTRVTATGSEDSRARLGARGALLPERHARTHYDPRQRGFYKLAVQAGKAVWTEPYAFYTTHRTGVTRTKPVYTQVKSVRTLHAVLTVDYDVHAMSSMLAARSFPGMRAVLYARDGTVLAYAGRELVNAVPILAEDRTLRFSDLRDPVMQTFFAQAERVDHRSSALTRVVQAGVPYLAVVAKASADAALDWSVAYLAPESVFLKELYRYQRRSLTVAASVLLVALLVAYGFARHVTRTRREMQAVKAEVRRAQAQVRELGSYRLVECLGRGGMGEVWRAEHRLLAREAAVKLINASALGDRDELNTRFRREAEALASLRSRNTIELFDYGLADDGTFFFVMELLDGMDLDTLVKRHGAQPWERVVPLLVQACASLAEAHDVGLVHRDIKPANIFVCRAADELDVVKVLDFGLVRAVSKGERNELAEDAQLRNSPLPDAQAPGLTSSQGAMGTPGFMPAEQIFGHALSGRADLYALGCVAVWLLSGKQLFDHTEAMSLIVATISEELPDLRARMPDSVPDALLEVVRRCLSRAPGDRPRDARALADLLRKVSGPASGNWTEEQKIAWWAMRKTPFVRPADSADLPLSTRTMVMAQDMAAQTDAGVLDGQAG